MFHERLDCEEYLIGCKMLMVSVEQSRRQNYAFSPMLPGCTRTGVETHLENTEHA